MKNILYIIIILAVLFTVSNFYKKNTSKYPFGSTDTVCTMDVKMCPDGSYVGRVGSDCHFPECPKK